MQFDLWIYLRGPGCTIWWQRYSTFMLIAKYFVDNICLSFLDHLWTVVGPSSLIWVTVFEKVGDVIYLELRFQRRHPSALACLLTDPCTWWGWKMAFQAAWLYDTNRVHNWFLLILVLGRKEPGSSVDCSLFTKFMRYGIHIGYQLYLRSYT